MIYTGIKIAERSFVEPKRTHIEIINFEKGK